MVLRYGPLVRLCPLTHRISRCCCVLGAPVPFYSLLPLDTAVFLLFGGGVKGMTIRHVFPVATAEGDRGRLSLSLSPQPV